MTEERETYRTADLALVAYLETEGHTYQRMERRGKQCVWVFADGLPLKDAVEEFQAGQATVEPREFIQFFGGVRKRMFEFLNEQPATA